jgi:hypothetical protein
MTVDDLIKLVRDGLVAAGKTRVPVVPPGTPITVVPAVVIAPADDELVDGNRTLRYGFDVTCLVPRGGQTSQYPALVEIAAIVVQSLIPSEVRFDGPLVFATTGGGETGEPAALARVVPVSFAADVTLC